MFDVLTLKEAISEWKAFTKKPDLRIKLTIRGRKRSFKVNDLKRKSYDALFTGCVALPILRRFNYAEIARNCFTVQPLPQPSALTYWFDEVTQ